MRECDSPGNRWSDDFRYQLFESWKQLIGNRTFIRHAQHIDCREKAEKVESLHESDDLWLMDMKVKKESEVMTGMK